jgi:hypothetical protein
MLKAFLSLILFLLPPLKAQDMISVNFFNGADSNSISKETGLIPDKAWNNIEISDKGEATLGETTKLTWSVVEFNGSKSPVFGIPTAYPDRIFRSQLRTNSFDQGALKITLDDLPASMREKGVDVIIYWNSAVEYRDKAHVQPFRVNGSVKWMISHNRTPADEFRKGEIIDKDTALNTKENVNTLIFRNVNEFPIVISTQRDTGEGGKGAGSNGGLAGFQILPAGALKQELP